jgi:hypothetical protein
VAKTRHIMIDSGVYDAFAVHAKENYFPVKRAVELILARATASGELRRAVREFVETPTVTPAAKSHDISKDLVRAEIKEMTQAAVIVSESAETEPDPAENSDIQDVLDRL